MTTENSRFHTMTPQIKDIIDKYVSHDINNVWIYGYGSLTWKPAFRYQQKRLAILPQYRRVFYQMSTDHRGNDDYYGLVATLIPLSHPDIQQQQKQQSSTTATPGATMEIITAKKDQSLLISDQQNNEQVKTKFQQLMNDQIDTTVGVCYQLYPEDVYTILEYLDYREKNGYEATIQKVTSLKPTTAMCLNSNNKASAAPKDNNIWNGNGNDDDNSVLDASIDGICEDIMAISWFPTFDNTFYAGYVDEKQIAERIVKAVGPSGPNIVYFNNLFYFMKNAKCSDAHLNAIHHYITQLQNVSSSDTCELEETGRC